MKEGKKMKLVKLFARDARQSMMNMQCKRDSISNIVSATNIILIRK